MKYHQICQVMIEPRVIVNIHKTNENNSRIAQEFERKSIAFLGKTILRLELTLKSALCCNTRVTWVKERGANKWESQTWQMVELQVTRKFDQSVL